MKELKPTLAYIEVHGVHILLFKAVYRITLADPEYGGTQLLPGQYQLVGAFHLINVCNGAENVFNGQSWDQFPLEKILSDAQVCHPVSIPGSLGRKGFPKIAYAHLDPGSGIEFTAIIQLIILNVCRI